MKFSQRMGITPLPEEMKPGVMTDALRNQLWNVIYKAYNDVGDAFLYYFQQALWDEFYQAPIDTMPTRTSDQEAFIRRKYFESKWYEVYDFIEYMLPVLLTAESDLEKFINRVLERHLAAYRLVGRQFVQVTDPEELAVLEDALADGTFEGVQEHLKQALQLMSDRENPDYRNSIKESISAVESIAQIFAEDSNASFGKALDKLSEERDLYPLLKDAWQKMYGWTNGEDGIRHAIHEMPDIGLDEAKYMLITCTSFINYLKSKMANR